MMKVRTFSLRRWFNCDMLERHDAIIDCKEVVGINQNGDPEVITRVYICPRCGRTPEALQAYNVPKNRPVNERLISVVDKGQKT